MGNLPRIEVSRIAIGSKVFEGSCFISYQSGAKSQYIKIECANKSGVEKMHKIKIEEDQETSEIGEIKYFIPVHDDDKKLECETDESRQQSNCGDSEEER